MFMGLDSVIDVQLTNNMMRLRSKRLAMVSAYRTTATT